MRPVPNKSRRTQDGFTIIEVLIALTILLIGIAGLLSMQLSSMRATSFSRHATEASTLAEDKMEALRIIPTAALIGGTDTVDSRAVIDPNAMYTRTWTLGLVGTDTVLTVTVSWVERGGETFTIRMSTVRT